MALPTRSDILAFYNEVKTFLLGLTVGLALATHVAPTPNPNPNPAPTPTPTPTPAPPWIPPGPRPEPPTPTPNPTGGEGHKVGGWEWRTLLSDRNFEGYGRQVDGDFLIKSWRPVGAK